MRCCECEAAIEYQTGNIKCRAGIHPYIQNSSKKLGCCCTKKQVQKYMKEELQTNSDRIRAMKEPIGIHNDVLTISINKLSDKEICLIFEEIDNFKRSGVLAANTNLRKIAKEMHDQYQLPNDVHMIEEAVLYEAARRYYNSFIG